MNIRRSGRVFLMMLLISVCLVALVAEKPIIESWNSLHNISDPCNWQCVGIGVGQVAAVAGWQDGALVLRYFTTEGELLKEQRIPMSEELDGSTITKLLPVQSGAAFLGIYGPNAEKLYLYRVQDRPEDYTVEAERMMALDCPGESFTERTSHIKFSELLYEDNVLSFAVWRDSALECYLCYMEGGVEKIGNAKCDPTRVLSVSTDQDGTLMTGGLGLLDLNGRVNETLAAGQAVTHLTPGRGGWYYIDAVEMDLCFVDADFGAAFRLATLDTSWGGVQRTLRSADLTHDESALLLLDGTVLTLTDAQGTRELQGILHPKAQALRWNYAKYAGLAIVLAALLWLLLCGINRGYASIIVLRGSLFAAAAVLLLTLARYYVLIPTAQSTAMRENETVVTSLLRSAHARDRLDDPDLADEISMKLEDTDAARKGNVRAMLAAYRDGAWRTADGRCAVTENGFSPTLAEEATAEEGQVSSLKNGVLQCVYFADGRVLCIRMEGIVREEENTLYYVLIAGVALLVIIMLLIQLSVRVDLRRISSRLEAISRGETPKRLNLRTGDELESMASIVNSLAASLKTEEERKEEIEESYRRFVPEKVLALLGKQTVEEVDKTTFAARRMAVMSVWFQFPDAFYTDLNSSRLLFDSVNEVIERAASIASRKGGSAFHFSYYGFDIVMDEDGEAVSTAVAIQQEMLSFNEQRRLNGLPCVTLHIALDKGNVMLGIVGDNSKIEPTMISTCLSTTQELIQLSSRLKAGILCTEAIMSEQQGYGNRYMGKCNVGKQSVRVYEVFDGDEFNIRRGKAASLSEFSEGVFDVYGGDATKAKHTFLKLAHNYPLDGGARYYLYLADRMEHDPSLPCVLNADGIGEGEV